MIKKTNKGFTLAELLIIIAIIAVLAAVVVPLFVGALHDANDRVEAANIRAVRAVGVSEILLNKDKYDDETSGELKGPWKVTATVDKNGNFSDLSVTKVNKKGDDEGYKDSTVTCYISESDLKVS